MPYTFDPKINRYIDDKGKAVPRVLIRDEVRKLTSHISSESSAIAKSLQAGKISLGEFQTQMSGLLKSGHIAAAVIGRGGRDQMTISDWGRVGSKVAWQNKYLGRFARKIESGAISPAMTNYRAGLYSSAIWTTYNQTSQETMSSSAPGLNPELCRLVTNSQEGCEECAADEAQGWMSVDDMGEIGSRICGDFCKCDIEFENDALNLEDFDIIMDLDLGDTMGEVLSNDDGDVFSSLANPKLTARQRFQLRQKIKRADVSIAKEQEKVLLGDKKAAGRLAALVEKRAKYVAELEGVPPTIVPPPPVVNPTPPPPVTPPGGGNTVPLTARQRFQIRQQIKRAEARIAKLEADVAAGKTHLQKSLDAAIEKRDGLVAKLSGKPVTDVPNPIPKVGKFELKPGETHAEAYLRTVKELQSKKVDPVQLMQLEHHVEERRKVMEAAREAWKASSGLERERLAQAFLQAESQLNGARMRLTNLTRGDLLSTEKARELLHVSNPMGLKGSPVGTLSSKAEQLMHRGLSEINKLVSEGTVANNYTIGFVEKRGRAFYNFGTNRVTFDAIGGRADRTVIHEIAHSFENKNPEILRMANAFLDYRTKGESPRWLGSGYDKKEIARPDKFFSAYVGKVYGTVGRQSATEVLSMGFEELWANPVGFATKDPEYFNFIVRLARGDKLRPGETMEQWLLRGKVPGNVKPPEIPSVKAPHFSNISPKIPDLIENAGHKVDVDWTDLGRLKDSHIRERGGPWGTDNAWLEATKLSKEEFHLLYNYTSSGDRLVNYRHHMDRLAGFGRELTPTQIKRIEKYREDLKWMLETKLEKYKGTVYRGERYSRPEYIEARGKFFLENIGKNVKFEDFTSTTSSRSVAGNFGSHVSFEIKSKTGANLDKIPGLPHSREAEVLFSPGKTFKIVSASKDLAGHYRIILEEVP